MTVINKNTNNDKRSLLQSALSDSDGDRYSYLSDFDDTYVYFEVYDDGYKYYRAKYSLNETKAEVSEDKEEVVKLTEYRLVEQDLVTEKGLLTFIRKHFGGTQEDQRTVIKQFQDEEMIAIEKLYIHPEDVDGVGDTITDEDTRGMVESLNKAIDSGTLQHGLFHKHKTEAFTVVKAWVAETDCTIGETDIKEGQPLIQVQFNNTTAWELRKSGDLAGISIGAKATSIEVLEDES